MIARNARMVTINGALAVDIHGQVVADTRAGDQYSGIGGAEDFVSGPGLRLDCRSLLCLPATAVVAGGGARASSRGSRRAQWLPRRATRST